MTDDEIRTLASQHVETLENGLEVLRTWARAKLTLKRPSILRNERKRAEDAALDAKSSWNLASGAIIDAVTESDVPIDVDFLGSMFNVVRNALEERAAGYVFAPKAETTLESALGFWSRVRDDPRRFKSPGGHPKAMKPTTAATDIDDVAHNSGTPGPGSAAITKALLWLPHWVRVLGVILGSSAAFVGALYGAVVVAVKAGRDELQIGLVKDTELKEARGDLERKLKEQEDRIQRLETARQSVPPSSAGPAAAPAGLAVCATLPKLKKESCVIHNTEANEPTARLGAVPDREPFVSQIKDEQRALRSLFRRLDPWESWSSSMDLLRSAPTPSATRYELLVRNVAPESTEELCDWLKTCYSDSALRADLRDCSVRHLRHGAKTCP